MVEPGNNPYQETSDSNACTSSTRDKTYTNNTNKSANRSRRLAATRGFDNKGLGRYNRTSTTPSTSPSKFLPAAGSTPLTSPKKTKKGKLLGISSLIGSLLTRSKSPVSRSLPVLPPRRPTSEPQLPHQNSPIVRKSVITPLHTPNSSLDWDNYFHPSQFLNPLEQRHISGVCSSQEELLADFRASLVPASESSDSQFSQISMSRFQQHPSEMDVETRAQLQNEMNEECKKLMDSYQFILDLMADYIPEDVNIGNVDLVENKLNEISDARATFRINVRNYKALYGEFGDADNRLDSQLAHINQMVREHAKSIWAQAATIRPPMSRLEIESLALQREQIQQQQQFQHQPRHNSVSGSRQAEGLRSCEGKKLLFRDQLRFLTDSLSLPDYGEISEHWKDQSESDIRKAMRNIKDWERNILNLSKIFREYEMLSKQYVDNSEELETDTESYLDLRNKVKEVIIAVQHEDERRNLQTLENPKTDKVSYPVFSGEAGEDLVRFREKINDCFRKNRIPESDQLDKLRENLRGAALKRVPITTKKLSVAWQNLEEAFGSPLLVLRERLKALSKIGTFPPDSLPGKQVTWFHDFEAILEDVLDLGNCDDLNMQMGAFGPPVQEQILKAFNDNPTKKQELAMSGTGKQPREKLTAYRDKIIEYRRRTQLAEVESGSSSDRKTSKVTGSGSAHVSYPGPKNNDSCRVCIYLRDHNNQDSTTLFEKHLGTLPIHCPNFIGMKMLQRRRIAIKAKFCIYCLHPDVEFSKDHVKMCREAKRKTKSSFTCMSPNCASHYWLCTNHAEDNKNKLRDAAKNLDRHGLKLAMHGTVALTTSISPQVRTASECLGTQVNRELIPVPDGQPIFMFFGAKGKTRSLMVFFDSGCSRFIMRECIPGQELPASLVKRGPIPIGGVGGVSVFASGEYIVAMDTVEGKAQQLQGVTVPVITGDFPQLDITEAVSAVKAGNRTNSKLRGCKFPKSVGGSVDCLIGIQYNQLQPKLVHMLPSGLAIYETKLTPFSKGHNYVLGGPHVSFDNLLARSGNAAFLLNEFVTGLTTWRNSGQPCLSQYEMSVPEVKTALLHNIKDGSLVEYEGLLLHDEEQLDTVLEKDQDNVYSEGDMSNYNNFELSCIDCGCYITEDSSYYEDEKLSRLKHIIDKQEQGIEISYRCVRCRNCQDCRNADTVDKISLREESEL